MPCLVLFSYQKIPIMEGKYLISMLQGDHQCYLYNDIVSVVANSDHGHDGAGSKDRSKTSIEPTCYGAMK